MKLQNLRYFEKLIQLKSYSNVAKFYDVSQPTVSLGIKRLEEDVGYNLITHNYKHNDFKLTCRGERFHNYSKAIVEQLNLLKNEVETTLDDNKINFGLPPMIYNTYFPDLAVKLSQNILLNLKTSENSSERLYEKLQNEEIDIALIGSVKPIKTKGFHSEILAKDKFEIVVSKKNGLSTKKHLSFKDIEKQNVITMTDEYIQSKVFKTICGKRFIKPQIIYQTNNPTMIKMLVHNNLGISFLLSKFIKKDDDLIVINPECKKIPNVYISLVWRDNYDLNVLEQGLVHTIRNYVNDKFTSSLN